MTNIPAATSKRLTERPFDTQIGRFSAVPRPFLRWAGSKQALLGHILPVLPRDFRRYYEPFLGSGAVYFALKPKLATLSDVSPELVSVWTSVRDHAELINAHLAPLRPNRELFYKLRAKRSAGGWARAAEFIYLNKTCWNGLYRVNSRGEFNVPYGDPRSDFISDPTNLSAAAKLLGGSRTTIRNCDFERAVAQSRQGDLVYFDPPYVTKHNYNGFRDWNEKLFRWSDQERLAKLAQRLADKGVNVVISNADHEDVACLYRGFRYKQIDRFSTLASNASRRAKVTEALFYT